MFLICFRCLVAIYLSSLVELETEIHSKQGERDFKTGKSSSATFSKDEVAFLGE